MVGEADTLSLWWLVLRDDVATDMLLKATALVETWRLTVVLMQE